MTEKTFTCIVCPIGCELTVRYDEKNPEDITVSGNSCPRGAAYAKSEITHPERTLTGTVRTDSKEFPLCPVKTSRPIPKEKMLLAAKGLQNVRLATPIHRGDKVIENFEGLDTDLIAGRTILL